LIQLDYLYRGLSKSMFQEAKGQVLPKEIGKPFEEVIVFDGRFTYNGDARFGESGQNSILMHQDDSSKPPGSGISTTPHFERARHYATHGNSVQGVVIVIDRHRLADCGITAFVIADKISSPKCPEDDEVLLLAADLGALPQEVIFDVIPVEPAARP